MPISRVRFRVDTTPDTDSTSDLTAAISSTSATSISVDDGTDFEVNQNIKVGSEEMTITNISSNTLTVVRGVNGTTAATHSNNANVFKDDSPTYTPTQNPNIGVVGVGHGQKPTTTLSPVKPNGPVVNIGPVTPPPSVTRIVTQNFPTSPRVFKYDCNRKFNGSSRIPSW